uniref:C2H2-type domain-containing protein n=1 Tax=Crocodylus porosus TaxID=8502 RepID=A0A7M4E1V0_CROPO
MDVSSCQQGLFCDCSILVEGKVFNTHRNVLFPVSLLQHGHFSPCSPVVMLDFVYSGALSLTGQNMIEVISAASYLQMTDIICACKTFIKSLLDISEKEKDCYFGLSEKELNTSEAKSPCLYRTEWTAVLHAWKWTLILGCLWWVGIPGTQRRHPIKKCIKRIGLSQSSDVPPYKSWKYGARDAEPVSHISQFVEQVQLDTEVDSAHVGYQNDLGSELLLKSLLVPQMKANAMRLKCPFCTHMVKQKADLKHHLHCHTIHQACKPICRKCKHHVTDLTRQVVQEGTRRYRLYNECLTEAGIESIPNDLEAEESFTFASEEDKESRWHFDEDHRATGIVDDSGLIIQEVETEDETEEKEIKQSIS